MDQAGNLDWVTARAQCATRRVFLELKDEIEADIEIRNGLLTPAHQSNLIEFLVDPHVARTQGGVDTFKVHRNGAGVFSMLKFECNDSSIKVLRTETKEVIAEASLRLNDEGQCRLVVEGKELTHWQFRLRALHDFLFGF